MEESPASCLGDCKYRRTPYDGVSGASNALAHAQGVGLGMCEVAGAPPNAREKQLEEALPGCAHTRLPLPTLCGGENRIPGEDHRGRRAHGGPVVRGCPHDGNQG